jgi:hypothetical protein
MEDRLSDGVDGRCESTPAGVSVLRNAENLPRRHLMTCTTTPIETVSELAFRETQGIAVSLVWDRATDALTVIVHDRDARETVRIPAPADRAMDVFRHPYAHVGAPPEEIAA